MTPNAQRIAIAEACPHLFWKGQYEDDFAWNKDALNDLNAIHEAEKNLTDEQKHGYERRLSEEYYFPTMTPATERLKILLQTIGKWDDSK